MGQSKPVFYLLAGPNGAGKSTLYRALVAAKTISSGVEFVNADIYEAAQLQHINNPQDRSEQARHWADARRAALLDAGKSFASETVFSHASKLALIEDAQAKGFLVMLLVVCLDQPERLLVRVAQRVAEGGHFVPPDRVLARYPRTVANLAVGVRLADVAMLYDSQGAEVGAHTLVAVCRKDQTRVTVQLLPNWTQQMLDL